MYRAGAMKDNQHRWRGASGVITALGAAARVFLGAQSA